MQPRLPLPVCIVCGAKLPDPEDRAEPRRRHCDRCLAERRNEVGRTLPAASRDAAARFVNLAGERPAHTADARKARARANSKHRQEQRDFETTQQHDYHDTEWYRRDVLPGLAGVTLTAIAKATAVSTSSASKWRAGRRVPHARHFAALAALVRQGPNPSRHSPSDVRTTGHARQSGR